MKKKNYEIPGTRVVEQRVETSVLTVSPPIDGTLSPDAQEGDVSRWGGWN